MNLQLKYELSNHIIIFWKSMSVNNMNKFVNKKTMTNMEDLKKDGKLINVEGIFLGKA